MTRTATHPIERTLADAAQLGEWFAASLGCAGTSLAMLVADRHELGAAVDRTCAHHETDDRRIGAAFLLGATAWRVIGPLAATYLSASRVPAVDPGTVRLRFDAVGRPAPACLTTPAFLALPDDPDAAHPDVATVDGHGALRTALRTTVAGTLAGLIPALKPWSRRGDRVQWAELSDAVAGVLNAVGEAIGEPQRARHEADRILDGTPPFAGAANWIHLDHGGVTHTRHLRNACCFAYLLDAYDYCLTCPLEDDDTRHDRWRSLMEDRR